MREDKILLRKARQFDPAALSLIHDRYYPDLYRYLLYRVGDPIVAEDLTSETFMRFLNALKAGRGPKTTLRGWLFGVANNLAADHFRHLANRPQAELDESLAADHNPAREAELNFEREEVRQAIAVLTPDQQEVLALRFGSEYSIIKTAQAMGKKENAVKALQFRAIAALRKELLS